MNPTPTPRRARAPALVLLAALLAASTPLAHAGPVLPDEVTVDTTPLGHPYIGTFYEHAVYDRNVLTGDSERATPDSCDGELYALGPLNDRVSRVEINDLSGCYLVLYENPDGTGRGLLCFSQGCADLVALGFNDIASSYRALPLWARSATVHVPEEVKIIFGPLDE